MSMLVTILVAALVMGLVAWIVTLFPIPQPFKQIALAVCGLILLLWMLSILGVLPGWGLRGAR